MKPSLRFWVGGGGLVFFNTGSGPGEIGQYQGGGGEGR